MQLHGNKYFSCGHPSPDPGLGSKGQNSIYSEHDQVAYQIKENHKCYIVQAHILLLHTPSTPRVGSRSKQVLLKVVIVSKGANIRNRYNRVPQCCISSKREWNIEHHASTYVDLTHTLNPWGGSKG